MTTPAKPTRDQRQLAYDAVGGLTATEIKQRLEREPTDCAFDRVAEAIADAEARGEQRGREFERADVVAWLRHTTDGTRACRDWVAHDVVRGEHVGAAGGKLTA